jgi:16S rRNA (cytidine1402-2'-O)-methyltransferase
MEIKQNILETDEMSNTDNEMERLGKLTLVATPIGNMGDITYRAVQTLSLSDFIVCEDTRTTNNLLKFYNIVNKDGSNKSLLTFHANSSEREIEKIIKLLKEGNQIAYVSDAGTPTISDPGVLLVQKILEINESASNNEEHVLIESLPGPSAITLAYSLSGLSGNSFVFYGFMPHKKGRETFVKEVLNNEMTCIFYESVHRIEKMLEQFQASQNELNIQKQYIICRELTKIYQEVIRGDLDYVIKYFKDNPDKIRGEFVVIVS